jgi:hypothetical protein
MTLTLDMPSYPSGTTIPFHLNGRNDHPYNCITRTGPCDQFFQIGTSNGVGVWTTVYPTQSGVVCPLGVPPGPQVTLAPGQSFNVTINWDQHACDNTGRCGRGPQVPDGRYTAQGGWQPTAANTHDFYIGYSSPTPS